MSVTCNMCDDTVDADDPPVPNKILSTNNDNNYVDADSTVNVINRLPTYLSNYFKIKEVKWTSLIVECTQCICSKTLSTPLNSTGNLYKHLRVSIFACYLNLRLLKIFSLHLLLHNYSSTIL